MDEPCEVVAWCNDEHAALVCMRAIIHDTGCPHTITQSVSGPRWEIRRVRRRVDPHYWVKETCYGSA